MRYLFLITVLLASPVTAQSPITATAFEAYTTGKTITYADQDGPYGEEQYLDGRRVRWTAENGDCVDGVWFPFDDQICFEYEDLESPQCWHFFLDDNGLSARFISQPPATEVFERYQSRRPLQCRGPDVGV